MIPDAKQTKVQIRADFDRVLDFVTGGQVRTATADQIERGLFTLLLRLGAKLLPLFFQMRSRACSRDETTLADGQVLPYHSEQKHIYFSIFGHVPLWRPYFYGTDRYSDLLRGTVEYLAVYVPYRQHQRHNRLYASPFPNQNGLEFQSLELAA